MKWVLRIFLAALFLLVVVAAIAWYAFPQYAQFLIDRAVQGKNIGIQLVDPGLPSFSGIPFGRLEAVLETPPDSCSATPASYTFVAHNGFLSWKQAEADDPAKNGLIPKIFRLELALTADSLTLTEKTANLAFSDSEPRMTGKLEILRKNGAGFGLLPESIRYDIENGALAVNQFRLDGISYRIDIDREGNWLQKPAPLGVASLRSGSEPVPLSNFEAWFSPEKNPENPCGLTLTDCSVGLFDLRAETPKIEYNPLEQKTRFTLLLESLPLEQLPGFQSDPQRPFATGQLSGSIPVEFSDMVLDIRRATIRADGKTQLLYYSPEGKPWLSVKATKGDAVSDIFRNLDATVLLKSEGDTLPGVALKSLSAEFLGGSLRSGPSVFDPAKGQHSFVFKLANVRLPEHIRLYGDFKGSLKGAVSGTLPLSIRDGSFSITNARLSSKGSGSVTHSPPRQKKSAEDTIFGEAATDVTYLYSEPDLEISRSFDGTTEIDFTLGKLIRKTAGGKVELLNPQGKLDLWRDKNNPALVTLSGFSARLMGGSIAINSVDYDMGTQTAETELVLDNIPLQELLNLQGMKKIYATGTLEGKIPVVMKNGLFAISAGNMNASTTGKIVYATTPEERAAANESMRITYEALSDFFYSELLSSITMTPDGESLIRLQLKGSNPSFQDGRPVHLNINLEQNLLDLLRSLTIATNIEQAISEKALQKMK